MFNPAKNKKAVSWLLLTIFIVGAFLVLFVLSAPQIAKAIGNQDESRALFGTGGGPPQEPLFELPSWSETILFVIAKVGQAILYMLGIFITIGAALLDVVAGVEKFTDAPVVKIGWNITRDLCNLGFALALLVMAFATVLQVQTFGMKRVLPRLVVAALLINFSLVFCGIIIDGSQVLTHFFLEGAKGESGASLSTQLANGLSITHIYKSPTEEMTSEKMGEKKDDADKILFVLVNLVFNIVFILVAAFSLFAAALFFLFRIVYLWLLMIMAPLAWVAMVFQGVPSGGGGAGSYWNKWWEEFLKWTFFAPVYSFFLYLAVLIATSREFFEGTFAASAQVQEGVAAAALALLQNGIFIIAQYAAIIIILLLGLQYAQKSGMVGAAKVTDWGAKAGKATARWTARKGTGYDRLAPALMSGTGSVVGFIPGLRKAGGAMKGKAMEMKEKQLGRRDDKLYNKYLNSLSDKELMDALGQGGRREKLQAAKIAKERGLYNKEDPETRKKAGEAMGRFKAFGMTKELREMEEAMPDQVKDADQRNEAIERAVANGADKRWKAAVFNHPEYGPKIVEQMRQLKSLAEMTNTIKGYAKPIKDAANAAIAQQITINAQEEGNSILTITGTTESLKSDPKYQSDLNLRKTYANTSGHLATAFNVPAGATDAVREQVKTEMKQFIKGMKPAQIGDVDDDDKESLKMIAENISKDTIASIRGELNMKQKEVIKTHINLLAATDATRAEIRNYMNGSSAWGGRDRGRGRP